MEGGWMDGWMGENNNEKHNIFMKIKVQGLSAP